jgi:hypothetical protein
VSDEKILERLPPHVRERAEREAAAVAERAAATDVRYDGTSPRDAHHQRRAEVERLAVLAKYQTAADQASAEAADGGRKAIAGLPVDWEGPPCDLAAIWQKAAEQGTAAFWSWWLAKEDAAPPRPAPAESAWSSAREAEVKARLAAVPKGPWARTWYEDGDIGEGPTGVYPGCRGDMVPSNDITSEPSEENPDGERVCECDNGKIADFVACAWSDLSDALAEIERLRASLTSLRQKARAVCESEGIALDDDTVEVNVDAIEALRAEVEKT